MAFLQRLSGERASVRSKPGEEVKDGSDSWLDAHYDPVASIYTFSSCMALEDLKQDGDHKLLVGDLGSGHYDMKLKVYRGTEMTFETPLLNMPTSVCTFYMDNTEPRTPAVAVASGSFIYIYRNLRPYFKFTLPSLQLNSTEADLWKRAKEDQIDAATLHSLISSMNSDGQDKPLTVRSLKLLQLDPDDHPAFVSVFKHVPLKRQTVITCMTVLKKSHIEDDAVCCLVAGTENRDIYILDPEAFTVLAKLHVPAVPVFLCVTGLYDVEYQVSVAARDACIYTIKGGGHTPKYKVALGSQPCGMQRVDKDVVVGCMDQTLCCFTVKGKRQWIHKLPDAITLVESMDYKTQGVKGVIVALRNKEVRIYRGKYLVNMLQVDDIVMGLKFGQFGREDGSLLMVTQGGALIIKILKRTANLETKECNPGPPKAQGIKLNLPKKTKIIVDQTVRERENFATMHHVYQRDLFRVKLETARSYSKAISSSLAPVMTAQDASLRISAQVQGLGPVFRLTVSIINSSPSAAPTDLFLTFKCNENLYRIKKKLIELPLLVPQLNYNFHTTVESLDDLGRAEDISVFVVKKGNPIPLITAVINMPLSENVIIV